MLLLKVYSIAKSILIFLLPFYFIGLNFLNFSVSILFIPMAAILLIEIITQFNENLIKYILINLIILCLTYIFYERFNLTSFSFFLFFSSVFFIKPIDISKFNVILYLTLAPIFLYILDMYYPFVNQFSFIENHGAVEFQRISLIFSEPSFMGLYYFVLLLFERKSKIHLLLFYSLVILICLSASLSSIFLLLIFLAFEYFQKSIFKLVAFTTIICLSVVVIFPSIIDRLYYLFSLDFLLNDYSTSIGNRLNSFFFLTEYYYSNQFSWIGQGWNVKDTFLENYYSYYEISDLGTGNIKNVISHLFYFLGIWGIYIYYKFLNVIGDLKKIVLFIAFCFSYNWLVHPLFYVFVFALLNYDFIEGKINSETL